MNFQNQSTRAMKEIRLGYRLLAVSFIAMLIFTVALIIPLNSGKAMSVSESIDTTPPQIVGATNIKIYLGEAPAYRKGITVTDDSGDDGITLTVNTDEVDIAMVGEYKVIYTATDAAGNKSSVTVLLTVEKYDPNLEELNRKLDGVISNIITDSMTTEQKIRAVYGYVQNHIAYTNDSDKSSWSAEAYNALFITGKGDCFSYYSASKAFFERLGIESLDIERPADIAAVVGQTHYWSIVNISDNPSEDVWYYYDSTRLRAEYNHSGCLLTEVQIMAYDYVREYFYSYERSGYPTVSEKIITPTPELEEFYNKD